MNITIRPVFNAAEVAMLATAIESHISYVATANAESAFDIESYKILKRKLDVHLAKLGINTPEYTAIREAGEDSTKWSPAQCYMKMLESDVNAVPLLSMLRIKAYEHMIETGISLTAKQNEDYLHLLGI